MLDSLRIKNFRCFEDLEIESLGRVNLIVGKNSVGKSTLLEAIFALAHNGSASFLAQILEMRNEFFDTHNIWPKIKNSHQVEEIFIGDSNTYLQMDKAHYAWDDSGLHDMKPFSNIETHLDSEDKLASYWDQAHLHSEEDRITDTLKILDNQISNVVFVQSQQNEKERVAILKIKNQADAVPLKAMGEGISRLLSIFLKAIYAKNGFLTIDEFENGLHYSIQEEVWEKIFELAEELDIQIFATTHSQDTIKSFCKVATENNQTEGKLISLGRSAKTSNKGQIMAVEFDEAQLKLFVDSGMEVRG